MPLGGYSKYKIKRDSVDLKEFKFMEFFVTKREKKCIIKEKEFNAIERKQRKIKRGRAR